MAVNPIPAGHGTVTPSLIVKGAAKAIDWYRKALGAEEVSRFEGPDGRIMHAEIKIGNSPIMLADESPEMGHRSPQSLGGTPVWPDTADAFADVIERHAAEIRPRLDTQVQTNEVRRCAALLGGFLAAARSAKRPLRLLEIGSSAGLLLFWDRYRYALGPHAWGDPASPLLLDAEWRGAPPDLDAPVRIASRRGCDLYPLDIRDPSQLRRIESYDPISAVEASHSHQGGLTAPMNGSIVRVLVEAGQTVEAGAQLVVLEAMKMLNTIRAPRAGRLYLGVNDNFWEDNTGQFNVTVDVN